MSWAWSTVPPIHWTSSGVKLGPVGRVVTWLLLLHLLLCQASQAAYMPTCQPAYRALHTGDIVHGADPVLVAVLFAFLNV